MEIFSIRISKNDIELFNKWKEGRIYQDFIDANMLN